MRQQPTRLYEFFRPSKYTLILGRGSCQLVVEGRKVGRPSKRITLHQKGLKVISAQIIRKDKKGDQQFEAIRINHLPTLQQVRLHTEETLFPGYYEVTIHFVPKP